MTDRVKEGGMNSVECSTIRHNHLIILSGVGEEILLEDFIRILVN